MAVVGTGSVPAPLQAKPGIAVPVVTTNPALTLSEYLFPAALVVLGVLFLLGLFLSISSRRARARRVDALGDSAIPTTPLRVGKSVVAPPQHPAPSAYSTRPPAPAPASVTVPSAAGGEPSIPLVQNIYSRVLTILWIVVTIVINVIALAKLLQVFGLAHENWHQPFALIGNLYDTYAGQAFSATSNYASQQFHVALPTWLMPAFVIYVAMASAFVAASTGLMKRNTSGEAFFGAVIHASWIIAVPAFVMDAVRYHVVARFARQNTVLFFAYIVAFTVAYVMARFINDDFLSGFDPSAFTAR